MAVLCSTSVTEHLARGILALTAIVLAIVFWPNIWTTTLLLSAAVILMRGCPTCWTLGLIETVWGKFRKSKDKITN